MHSAQLYPPSVSSLLSLFRQPLCGRLLYAAAWPPIPPTACYGHFTTHLLNFSCQTRSSTVKTFRPCVFVNRCTGAQLLPPVSSEPRARSLLTPVRLVKPYRHPLASPLHPKLTKVAPLFPGGCKLVGSSARPVFCTLRARGRQPPWAFPRGLARTRFAVRASRPPCSEEASQI